MDKRRINGHWYAIGVPDRCPVCNIKKRNVLLHIHSKDSCKEKIDKQMIENWKKIEQKNKTKKYKQKYIESGGNKKAVRKYQEKLKAQKDEIKRKEKIRESYLNEMAWNKERFIKSCKVWAKRLEGGRLLKNYEIKERWIKLEGIEIDKEKDFIWLNHLNGDLLEAIVSLQIVSSIPKEIWLSAVQTVERSQERSKLKDMLYRLINKLQENEPNEFWNEFNTKGIDVPRKYKTIPKIMKTKIVLNQLPKDESEITNYEKKLIFEALKHKVGDADLWNNDFQELLCITDQMNDLFVALAFCSK